jgi:hypothetical protein
MDFFLLNMEWIVAERWLSNVTQGQKNPIANVSPIAFVKKNMAGKAKLL